MSKSLYEVSSDVVTQLQDAAEKLKGVNSDIGGEPSIADPGIQPASTFHDQLNNALALAAFIGELVDAVKAKLGTVTDAPTPPPTTP